MNALKITDNDAGEISATIDGQEIRGWCYHSDAQKLEKMRQAREFAEGWHQAARYFGLAPAVHSQAAE